MPDKSCDNINTYVAPCGKFITLVVVVEVVLIVGLIVVVVIVVVILVHVHSTNPVPTCSIYPLSI